MRFHLTRWLKTKWHSDKHAVIVRIWVWINQSNRFPPNICGFLLPTRPRWVEPAGGEEHKLGGKQKSANIVHKTLMLIYPYPKNFTELHQRNFFHQLNWSKNNEQSIKEESPYYKTFYVYHYNCSENKLMCLQLTGLLNLRLVLKFGELAVIMLCNHVAI